MIDLFNDHEKNEAEGNMTNKHFLGSLDKFNLIFQKNSWAHAHEDILKLPKGSQ